MRVQIAERVVHHRPGQRERKRQGHYADEDLDGIQRNLDELGQDGWELVSVTCQSLMDENEEAFDQYTMFFKRPA